MSLHTKDEDDSGRLGKRLKDGTNFLSFISVAIPLSFLHYGMFVVVGVGMTVWINPQLSLIVLAILPPACEQRPVLPFFDASSTPAIKRD